MFEIKRDVKTYNWAIVIALFLAVVLGILIIQWPFLGPFATIAFSAEFGATLIVISFLIQRRKEAVQRDEGHEDQSIQRINEINNSFAQLANELQQLNEKIKDGIIKSRKDLDSLQTRVIEISKQEQEFKNQIKIWQEVKPEAAKIISDEIKKGESKNYIYGFILYLAGLISPYLINFIFFRKFCF
jgi:uncharacterized membrane protein